MFRSSLTVLVLPLLLLVGTSSDNSAARPKQKSAEIQTETVEKMIASTGTVAMEVDLNRLNDTGTKTEPSTPETARFTLAPDSFFTIIVTDDVFRSSLPGSISLIPQSSITVPAPLSASLRQLSLEKKQTGAAYEMVVRDSKSGFLFFNVEGHSYDYEASKHLFSIDGGRLIVSEEFAAALGRPAQAGSVVGKISLSATMLTIERTGFVNGEATSDVMPSSGTFPGPDVIVGDLNGLAQFDGSSGTQVGLAVGTDSCNAGTVDLDWFATPDNNHPVIPQNMYRMSGGATNDERFEQIGQSNAKHAFTALTENICGLGCNGTGGTHLGSGCSDPYVAGLNSGQSNHNLGSRAWINPFTGAFPRGDSATPPNNHAGHTHTGPAHRILVEINDLNTSLNPGATYYAEAQYVTPHEYVWCQAHGQCNMYNNVSYRRYNVSGTASPFTFTTGGFTTQRMQAAISAWPGAAVNKFEPAPGIDGIGYVGVKVTNPSAGVWHYEYAIYNQNIDRAIQSFSVPIGPGVTISNIGFHAPPQHPGWAADGTVGDAGYSSTPWTPTQTANSVTWNSQTFAANQNANAIRWGTLYNFRFDANLAPLSTSASLGFFKTGSPMAVDIQAPVPPPTPTPTPTPIPTPTPLPPTPTPSPTLTPIPSGVAVSLPTAMIDTSINNFVRPVTVSNVNASDNLIGFQADFTFDQTIATFQSPPVSAAGLTATNWNVSGNVLPGAGPIRTLRVSSFSTDGVTPLSGSGTLFSLNMTRVSSTSGATTALTWAPPPNDFAFYDTDLNAHTPSDETAGSITIQTVVSISGAVDYCSNPSLNAVPGVTMTLSGSASGSTLSDGSGNYSFASLASGGSYTVTPSKTALVAGSAGITTVDVLAVQRHFLGITLIPAGCRLTAADVTGDTAVTTVDVVAVQRFFLGFTAGTANAGKYSFSPANRTYPSVGGNQTSQNYDALVFGDVASSFVHRPGGSSPEAANEIFATVAMISLPEIAADHSRNFVAPVTTTAIDAANKLVGFQGDLTFDERMVRFENNPVQKAGLTAGNWNVSGNVLDGPGPIRTLRVSAYSTDFQPLAGKGTLFELRMVNAGNGAQSTPLVWSASPNQFIFIDADLNIQRPGNAPAGNVKR